MVGGGLLTTAPTKGAACAHQKREGIAFIAPDGSLCLGTVPLCVGSGTGTGGTGDGVSEGLRCQARGGMGRKTERFIWIPLKYDQKFKDMSSKISLD